jgi:MFS family permease
VLLVVSLGFFMTLLDLTIVNIAIPNLITNLHASLDDVLWVINAYALVLAVLVITAGRLGDLVGPRVMFTSGIAVFTAASAACGLAPSPGWRNGAVPRSACGARWPVWPRSPGRPWAACLSPRSTGGGSST